MSNCIVTPFKKEKACTGKCGGESCSTPHVYVAAACGAMIVLFDKQSDGNLIPLTHNQSAVLSSLDDFKHMLSEHVGSQDHLVIVGISNDIAWVHASLTPDSAKRVSAEIEYPLIADWFRNQGSLQQLANAVGHLFAAP